jgi:hypothetical protein
MFNTGCKYGDSQEITLGTGSVFLFNSVRETKTQALQERVSQGYGLLKEVYSTIDSELIFDIFEANKFDIVKAAEILDELNQW